MNLQQENIILKKKLKIATDFIKREVENSRLLIHSASRERNVGIEQDGVNQLVSYFGERRFMGLPSEAISQIISGEILFHQIEGEKMVDGAGVLICYQKAIDSMVETYVASPFRHKMQEKNTKRYNTVCEKNLEQVVKNGKKLSLGRFYQILTDVSYEKGGYHSEFVKFLHDSPSVFSVFFEETFLEIFGKLIESGVFGEKRHVGYIDQNELLALHELFLGKDKYHSFLYMLASLGEIEI